MIEIVPHLFVGGADDEIDVRGRTGALKGDRDWFVISAAKSPYHREALGYTTPGAPKDHEEYLIARRPGRLILNLIDGPDPAFVRDEIINAALDAVDEALDRGENVLIHCNQGQSRAPTLALLWLNRHRTPEAEAVDYDTAAEAFRKIYPTFAPGKGMEGYARAHWAPVAP